MEVLDIVHKQEHLVHRQAARELEEKLEQQTRAAVDSWWRYHASRPR
jgi:hypothetical protein